MSRGRKNKEAYNAYMREYNRQKPERRRSYDLKRFFGISLEEYNTMLEQQDGVCAICGQPETVLNRRTKQPQLLSVDHDHDTGKVRGLLCTRCNTAIGLLQDDPDVLVSALSYLKGSNLM